MLATVATFFVFKFGTAAGEAELADGDRTLANVDDD